MSEFYTLENEGPTKVTLLAYGARIARFDATDRDGKVRNIVLGMESAEAYRKSDPFYFGCTVGPIANRVSNGRFWLNGEEISLPRNEGTTCLHGAMYGLNFIDWEVGDRDHSDEPSITFYLQRKHLQDGLPGNRSYSTKYRLRKNGAFEVHYQVQSDMATVVNLTNHSYFNLTGEGTDILSHTLTVDADWFVNVDDHLIPTGEILSVAEAQNGALDYRSGKLLKDSLNELELDHCFVITPNPDSKNSLKLSRAAVLSAPNSVLELTVFTSSPGVQLYSGQHLDHKAVGLGAKLPRYAGLAIEPQYFPDAPNVAHFPSIVLQPGAVWSQQIAYVAG